MVRPTDTSFSCIACSRAAWVLGGVRLISSARRKLVKIGPGMNSNWYLPLAGSSLMTSVPVMSEGIRSGVNWTRRKVRSRVRARVRAMSVLPSPGTPNSRMCPRQSSPTSRVIEDLLLPDDHLGQLFPDSGMALAEPGDDRRVLAGECRAVRGGTDRRLGGLGRRHLAALFSLGITCCALFRLVHRGFLSPRSRRRVLRREGDPTGCGRPASRRRPA